MSRYPVIFFLESCLATRDWPIVLKKSLVSIIVTAKTILLLSLVIDHNLIHEMIETSRSKQSEGFGGTPYSFRRKISFERHQKAIIEAYNRWTDYYGEIRLIQDATIELCKTIRPIFERYGSLGMAIADTKDHDQYKNVLRSIKIAEQEALTLVVGMKAIELSIQFHYRAMLI